MATAEENHDLLTNESSVGAGIVESENIVELVDVKRNASSTQTSSENMEYRTNNGDYAEEIEQWVSSLERILENVPRYMCTPGHPGRISRIPQNLREVDVKGYEPYILSIGPYHHGLPRVQPMEMRKKLALKCVLKSRPELTLKDFLKVIIRIEPTARSFYSDVEMEREQFVRVLLLDSVYLLTMFCGMPKVQQGMNEVKEGEDERNAEGSGNLKMMQNADESNDEEIQVKIGEHWYWTWSAHDLFLLENQLPFFVLQEIHNLAYGGSETEFLQIMKYSFVSMLRDYTRLDSEMITSRAEEVHHLLHLCHMFFRPTIQRETIACHFPESSQMFRLGSAKQLYEAGVHFEATTQYSILDIKFDSSGNMTMPCLHVDDNTESLLRNLIALEQMKYPSMGLDITAYVVLLLHLVTTPKDVELLRRKGIIQHHLSSDKEMMYLVNRLSTGLAFDYTEDQYSLKYVFKELKLYSERRLPRWHSWLKHRHFGNPWTTISLLVASILLLLTFVQTFYAVYSYYYPYYNGHW